MKLNADTGTQIKNNRVSFKSPIHVRVKTQSDTFSHSREMSYANSIDIRDFNTITDKCMYVNIQNNQEIERQPKQCYAWLFLSYCVYLPRELVCLILSTMRFIEFANALKERVITNEQILRYLTMTCKYPLFLTDMILYAHSIDENYISSRSLKSMYCVYTPIVYTGMLKSPRICKSQSEAATLLLLIKALIHTTDTVTIIRTPRRTQIYVALCVILLRLGKDRYVSHCGTTEDSIVSLDTISVIKIQGIDSLT